MSSTNPGPIALKKLRSAVLKFVCFECFGIAINIITAVILALVAEANSRAVLYAYYLSSCSWRVRTALVWKGLPFEERPVDIVRGQHQLSDEYKAVNPAQKVPALFIDGETIVESMAILQYLEDTRPNPSLTPEAPILRARMREICETIVSGIQPLQNIGLKRRFPNDEQFQTFAKENTDRGLKTLETLLKNYSGQYCVGDQLTMADLCFVPQIYNATTRLQLDIGKYPTVSRLFGTLIKDKVFVASHPQNAKNKQN